MQLRRRRKPRAEEPTEGDLQLAQARQLQRRTAAAQPRIDRITAEAEEHAESNNMSMLIRRALQQQHEGHA